jgi:excisionase family DNA binding protein
MNTRETVKRLLLRPPEAAEVLGISRALAYRWAQDGTLPTIRVGRAVRIPHDALVEWIDSRTKRPVKSESIAA